MAWLEVHEYGVKGWSGGIDSSERARHYCRELERGAILFFSVLLSISLRMSANYYFR